MRRPRRRLRPSPPKPRKAATKPKSTLWLAVTGGIAEGKSTVVGFLSQLGYPCCSADEVVRSLWADSATMALLGRELFDRPEVDRNWVRQAILDDPRLRRRLNEWMHPHIWDRMVKSQAVVFEVPLLIEAVLHLHFDHVWCVTCGPDEQLRRLSERLNDEAQAKKIIAAQLPSQVKSAFAEKTVRTNREIARVFEEVQGAVARLEPPS